MDKDACLFQKAAYFLFSVAGFMKCLFSLNTEGFFNHCYGLGKQISQIPYISVLLLRWDSKMDKDVLACIKNAIFILYFLLLVS